MNDGFEEMEFSCKECGSNEVLVYHNYDLIRDYIEVNRDELVVYEKRITEYWEEWGPLDETHRWEYEDSEKTGSDDELLDYYSVDEDDLEEYLEAAEAEIIIEVDEDSHEFFVLCAGCEREIEFGWSHPDRGGRIWPAESSDFNPWKSWPEPRYRESWRIKGWLRPGTYE